MTKPNPQFAISWSGSLDSEDKKSRNEILPILKKEYPQFRWSGIFNYAQAPLWFTLIPYLSGAKKFAFGYIKEDDFWHFKMDC